MNVSLTPELEQFIADQVAAGRYRSASEAVRAAIRTLEDQTREREAKLQVLRKAVEQGLVELDHGEGLDGEQVFEGILASLDNSGQ
ncbi:MAG: type II toxin-antitoxin system ParD family antitoxin [Persicimonas sp.]